MCFTDWFRCHPCPSKTGSACSICKILSHSIKFLFRRLDSFKLTVGLWSFVLVCVGKHERSFHKEWVPSGSVHVLAIVQRLNTPAEGRECFWNRVKTETSIYEAIIFVVADLAERLPLMYFVLASCRRYRRRLKSGFGLTLFNNYPSVFLEVSVPCQSKLVSNS